MKDLRDIIKRPVITEHSADLMAEKRYTFEVDSKANKTQIKQAVESVFGVTVSKVNTMNKKVSSKQWDVTVDTAQMLKKLLCNYQRIVKT